MKRYLYLESGGVYKKLLRISRTKNIITGSFFNSIVRVFPGLKDLHFTYPPKGNYHVTVVGLEGTEYRIYSNSATRRGVGDRESEQIDRESLPFAWKMFVPNGRMRPSFDDFLVDPKKWENILTIGLSCIPLTGPSETSRTNDMIFSYKANLQKSITLNVLICGSDYIFNPVNPNFPQKPLFESRDRGSPQVLVHFF